VVLQHFARGKMKDLAGIDLFQEVSVQNLKKEVQATCQML